MLDIKGRTVVITGGATGIGFGIAKACDALGANVVVGGPRQKRLDEAVASLAELGVGARAFLLDVTDAEQFAQFADSAFAAFGDVALIVNNAGVGQQRGSVMDTAEASSRRSSASWAMVKSLC